MSSGTLPITDRQGLRQALADAIVPTLLMVYVQYTQDAAYLERFAPCIRSMFSIEPTNISEELAAVARIRAQDDEREPGRGSRRGAGTGAL